MYADQRWLSQASVSGVVLNQKPAGVPVQSSKSEFETLNTSTVFYTINAKLPFEAWDKNHEMEDFVNQVVAQKEEEWKIGGEAYMAEQELSKQFSDRPKMVYSMDIEYKKIISEKKGTVSYVFYEGEYTGGANGDESVHAFTFNKQGRVDLESVLNISGTATDEKEHAIPNDIAISKLIDAEAIKNTEYYPDPRTVSDGLGLSYLGKDGVTLDHKKCHCDGFFFGSNLQNFVITDDGVTFYFGKGVLTARAAGSVGVIVPWDQLKPFLMADWK